MPDENRSPDMRYVELPGTDLRASALGFGCASIKGRVDRRTALDALERAHDLGVNYFDVARSYGYGEAEAVLGEFLQGRRSDVLVATKVGLAPPSHNGLLRAALPVARRVLSWVPQGVRDALRDSAAQSGATEAAHGRFEVADVRESLETSLRKLGTDYVDVLLLHECRPADAKDPELRSFLDQCVQQGKIRHYGLATSVGTCNEVLREHSEFRVAQFASNLCEPGMEKLTTSGEVATVTHSPLSRGNSLVQRIADHATQHPETGQAWSARTGLDLRTPGNVARVLLSYAFQQNPQGVVLCGMFDAHHLSANVGTAVHPISGDALNHVVQSMRETLASGVLE
ncbi:aryl-alcohol dehydrogenase-like predicted oxidoreductase [Salinibacter ruber]|uniref:aldo/keto reductase n=1 Tax=Salinibacter ruber TaxID=146919 RepID=UPI002169A8A3|nr:aldo/keto reductase [Salinibacter ruber]MCS3700178.1 aryl-alcohol dehydrogenase-like predicted oxidoreductase [Salinibacter ruber]